MLVRYRWWLGLSMMIGVFAALTGRVPPPRHGASGLMCQARGDDVGQLPSVVVTNSPALALPYHISAVGRFLVVLDHGSESPGHVVEQDGAIRPFGRRGSGPREFQGAWGVDADPHDDHGAWIYDVALKRMSHLSLDDPAGPSVDASSITLRSGSVLMGAFWSADRSLLVPALLIDAVALRYDSAGTQIEAIGGTGEPRYRAKPQLDQVSMAAHPDRMRFVLVGRHRTEIAFIDLRSESHSVRRVKLESSSAFVPNVDRIQYADVAVTADWIAVLHSGRSVQSWGSRAAFGKCLLLVDWEGNVLEAYGLDREVLAISVTEDGRTVYAVQHDPNPAVLAYSIPDRTRETAVATTPAPSKRGGP